MSHRPNLSPTNTNASEPLTFWNRLFTLYRPDGPDGWHDTRLSRKKNSMLREKWTIWDSHVRRAAALLACDRQTEGRTDGQRTNTYCGHL